MPTASNTASARNARASRRLRLAEALAGMAFIGAAPPSWAAPVAELAEVLAAVLAAVAARGVRATPRPRDAAARSFPCFPAHDARAPRQWPAAGDAPRAQRVRAREAPWLPALPPLRPGPRLRRAQRQLPPPRTRQSAALERERLRPAAAGSWEARPRARARLRARAWAAPRQRS